MASFPGEFFDLANISAKMVEHLIRHPFLHKKVARWDWGANTGFLDFRLYSHHSTAERQRQPKNCYNNGCQ
jgi:hypothetical protein